MLDIFILYNIYRIIAMDKNDLTEVEKMKEI